MGTSKNGHTLLALTIGAAIGGAVAILYAPRSGKETRAKIKMDAELASMRINNAANELKGKVLYNMEEGGDELGYVIGSIIARTTLGVKEIIKALEKEITKLQSENGQ